MSTTVRVSPPRRLAGALIIVFWGLLAANTWVAAVTVGVTGSDVSFLLLLMAGVVAIVIGLIRRSPWAWWAALGLAVVGLFFVLPVTSTILLGGPTDPVGTGWDVVFFPLTTAVLVALLAVLRTVHARSRTEGEQAL
jgi:peptidoglycan/LPS O-acetylase OafA/YrhL